MILYNLKKNKNKKMPNAYGKYYAYPVVTQTIGMDGLATHMSGHNTPFSPGAIKGMLTDMVICVRELALQGIAVKLDNLAIFSSGIKNNEGVKLRARATGELMSDKLNLDATLKKATALSGDGTTDKNSPSTPSGGGTSQGGGGTSQGGDTPSAGGDNPGGGEGE